MDEKFRNKRFTLTDGDITSKPSMSRRSLLSALGLGLVAAAAVVGPTPGVAQGPSGCTDDDLGRYQDPPGYGRNCRSGPGPNYPGNRPNGCTDFDGGRYADPPGAGSRCGPGPGGQGPAGRPNGCTDSDAGMNQDPPGQGTRCWI